VDHVNRLNDDELLAFRSALEENKALMKTPGPATKQFANELKFYDEVLFRCIG